MPDITLQMLSSGKRGMWAKLAENSLVSGPLTSAKLLHNDLPEVK